MNIDIEKIKILVEQTGEMLLSMQGSVSCKTKPDGSPVTDADLKASEMLYEGLKKITPDIPLISEEFEQSKNKQAAKSKIKWVADPLDGTRSFLNGKDGYGCHLALIIDGSPVLGFASFPSKDPKQNRLYFTAADGKAYKKNGESKETQIKVKKFVTDNDPVTAIGWRDNIKNIFNTKITPYRAVGGGRMCLCAEGEVDIALFDGYFSDWDLAAAHAILNAAGGELYNKNTGTPITYETDTFIVPPSIAGHPDIIKKVLKPQDNKQQCNTSKRPHTPPKNGTPNH